MKRLTAAEMSQPSGKMEAMEIRRVGAAAWLVECADADEVEAVRVEAWRRRAAGLLAAVDIVPGECSVLLDGTPVESVRALVDEWPPGVAAGADQRDVPVLTIETVFDGVDLGDVAALWGVSTATVVTRLTGVELRVAFCGFAPGFAYLRGLPADWAVPRLAEPRTRVPAGSVALAGGYAGIYPSASPGGWRLVGHTHQTLFDVRRAQPALLTPGARVRLAAA